MALRGHAGETSLVTFDPAKDEQNIVDRGLSFRRAEDFDWSTAVIESDRRKEYGEPRFRAYGFLDGRLHALVFTHRDDDIRVLSLRRANRREQVAYVEEARSLPPR